MLLRVTMVGCAVLLALIFAWPGHAQVKMEDLAFQNKTLEPGAGMAMLTGTQTGSAALGDGVIVFKFKITDIDPIADDTSDVEISCLLIQNLGTATATDIIQVIVLDQDSNAVAAPAAVEAAATTDPTTLAGCNSMARTNPNAQIIWERFFDLGLPGFVIPDDGTEEFQVAVRVSHRLDATGDLLDDSQNHTLVLRATIQLRERVGSPPNPTTFVDPVTDSAPEVIWNGGINRFTEDTWVVNPIMPGSRGVVTRFTICDDDSNEHQLILDRFFIRQDERGTALSSDIVSLDLYRVEGFTRTLIASRTPDVTFERGNGGVPGLELPGGGFTAITIPDDTCYTFELEAQVSPFAFKGHVISPRISVSAEEPFAHSINQTVEPELRSNFPTLIGKGLIVLPDTRLIGKPGILPLQVAGVQLPGVGTLQVGPWGKLQYDPRVINVKSIRGVGPYVVDAVEIDNRLGEVRFTVRVNPAFDVDDDGDPDNPLLTAYQDGTIANIFIEPIGDPGDKTRLLLTFDCFELVDQMNCMPVGFPFPDTPNQSPNNDISVSAGEVTLLYPGDIDMDGQPTVRDALKLASALLACTGANPTLPSPDDDPPPSTGVFDPRNTTLNFIMTDEQKSIADVASPFAAADEIPDCDTLTSADVAEIARLAINFGTSPAPKAIASASSASGEKPWYGFLGDLWNWLTGARAPLAQVALDFDLSAQTLRVNASNVPGMGLGGIEGQISYDPASLQVQSVTGASGYRVLAYHVDNVLGEVRFLAVAAEGRAFHQGTVVELQVSASDQPFAPSLAVEALVDVRALDVPFTLARAAAFAAAPTPLSLSSVQALSQGHGSFRFQATGNGIAGIRVQVYDLAGGMVFDQEASGNTLLFSGLSSHGKPLANGVYLYVVTAKGFQDQSIRSQVNKLPILR